MRFFKENCCAAYESIKLQLDLFHPDKTPLELRDAEPGETLLLINVDGQAMKEVIERFFADPRVDYIHAHYAKAGCFAARIDRAGSLQSSAAEKFDGQAPPRGV